MRSYYWFAGLVSLLTVVYANSALAWPARVVHVTDGDTVTVVNTTDHQKHRIRLHGIDAPETDHGPGKPAQPYGNASRKALTHLLARADVTVRPTVADPTIVSSVRSLPTARTSAWYW